MKFWLIAIYRTVPRRWIWISLPFVIPILAFAGWFLFGGLFVEPVPPQHLAYQAELERLRPMVARGDVGAKVRTALILRDGLSGERDIAQAAKLLDEAARSGNANARVALGKLYETGLGVRQDYRRAAEWYRLAAGFGRHAEAQYALGDLYFYGRGVANDYAEAIAWYRRAAMQGHAGAQSVMASMYEKGFGVDQNHAEAFVWYSLAAANRALALRYRKDIDPARELVQLKEKMSRLDRSRGEQRLRQVLRRVPRPKS